MYDGKFLLTKNNNNKCVRSLRSYSQGHIDFVLFIYKHRRGFGRYFVSLIFDGVKPKVPRKGWHHFESGEISEESGYGVAENPINVVLFQLVKCEL